jgi:hypothetical protein
MAKLKELYTKGFTIQNIGWHICYGGYNIMEIVIESLIASGELIIHKARRLEKDAESLAKLKEMYSSFTWGGLSYHKTDKIEEIAHEIGYNPRTIQKHIDRLLASGELTPPKKEPRESMFRTPEKDPMVKEIIKLGFKAAAQKHHPDHEGGSNEDMKQ